MGSGTTIQSVNTRIGREAVAFDCGGRVLVVGRTGLFAQVPRCEAEIRAGSDLEAVLRQEIDSPRDQQTLTQLYRLVGPEMCIAQGPHRKDMMIRHIAHAGGVRACWLEKVPPGSIEAPDSIRSLTLGEAPGRAGIVGDLDLQQRFHEVLLRSGSYIPRDFAEEWQKLTSPESLIIIVGSLALIGAAIVWLPAVVPVLLGVGFALAAWEIFGAIGHWWDAFKLTRDASSHEDLDRAAQELAKGFTKLGIGLVVGLLTRGVAKIAPLLRAPTRRAGGIDEVTGLPRTEPAITEPVPARPPRSRPRQTERAESNSPKNTPKPSEEQVEIKKALDRVEAGGPFPYKKDGTKFKNREGRLPDGDYREYTVDTPGATDRAKRRLVIEQSTQKTYYTDDHYSTFKEIDRTSTND